jgi:hypothetical protein
MDLKRGDMQTLTPDHQLNTSPIPLPTDSPIRIGTAPEAVQRILVIVPSLDIDLSYPVQKLWEQAKRTGAHIHFMGFYNDPAEEPGVRRGLAMLSAMVQEKKITTSIETLSGKNWQNALQQHATDMDLVMYFPEPRTGFTGRLFKQALPTDLNVPIYILSGTTQVEKSSGIPAQLIPWVGSFLVLTGSFFIQVRITQAFQGWFQTMLLVLTVLPEYGFILWLNSSL